jgi:peptidoglycan/xylan/chitin deacetylase (PgdA/CDA1 family)
MLNFRNTSRIYLVLLTFTAALSIYWPGGFIILAAITAGYLALLVFGSVFVCSGFYLKVFCKGDGKEKRIALSFDDGPDPDFTPELLDLLKENGIKAAFFCIGNKVRDNKDILIRMTEEGHLVGNHSFSHSKFFDLKTGEQMATNLNLADKEIIAATGVRPEWLRPPFGVTNPALARAVNARGYKVMGWSIRSLDTSVSDPEKIMSRIRKRWHPGAVILLHDTNDKAIRVVRMIIAEAEKKGYTFGRADRI